MSDDHLMSCTAEKATPARYLHAFEENVTEIGVPSFALHV